MEITEVRIKLMEEPCEKLRAFCSITFDGSFVVRDLKIIEGSSGPFVAMPSRKLTSHCPRCRFKNQLRAAFCNQCGGRLAETAPPPRDETGRNKLYADIAHPINTQCREMIQEKVISAYEEELVRSQEPGYVSTYDDFPPCEDGSGIILDENAAKPETPPPAFSRSGCAQKETLASVGCANTKNRNFGAGIFD